MVEFDALSKPQLLFLQLVFEQMLDGETEAMQTVFAKGFKDDLGKKQAFVKGLSEFMLGRFYARLKKKHGGELPREVAHKVKAVFKVIKLAQGSD